MKFEAKCSFIQDNQCEKPPANMASISSWPRVLTSLPPINIITDDISNVTVIIAASDDVLRQTDTPNG